MLSSRIGGVIIMVLFMLTRKKNWRVSQVALPLILLNGCLDIAGNGCYILASQTGRLDVAAVLSSLYPAATVLLAATLLKERFAHSKAIGILLALIAIALLTI